MNDIPKMRISTPLKDEHFYLAASAVMMEACRYNKIKFRSIMITNVEVHYDPLDRNDYCVISGKAY